MKNKKINILLFSFSLLLLSSCEFLKSKSNIDNLSNSVSITPMITSTQSPATSSTILKNNDKYIVSLDTKYGPVEIELFADKAPKTVENFLSKIQSGFYNNLTFHRVVSGFVVQGGDPTGTGTGGGKISSEINNIPFKRGSLGLARTPDTKEVSNDSQFFICLTDDQCSHLTGEYVNFGQVISGMEYVDQIKQGDKIIEINPLTK